MSQSVDFYFDFSSSYSYVALPGVVRLASGHEVDFNWKPFLLGVAFQALKHAPPDFATVKGRYIRHDVERCAGNAGLAYTWPQPFPFNSLLAARATSRMICRGVIWKWSTTASIPATSPAW